VRHVDARVVHQHVEAAEPAGGVVDHRAHRRRVRQVGPHRDVPAAGQAVAQRRRRGGGLPVVDRHPVPACRERPHDRRTDTTGTSGHENCSLSHARDSTIRHP